MKTNLLVCVLSGLSLAGAASVAQAQEQGGVVRGNTNINVNAENVNTIATGSGNVARTNIGSVKKGSREGSNVTVDVKNVSNVVSGRGKKGCINIGVQGADPECK
ncbi:hypothetical protein [Propionivibrio sp.]|uniref:hypothetical protein n=1 Tax=Propionivibrio sp. TaxID=2212460 RepID=UPI003BF3B4DE